jgi:hypothetical protein
MYGLAPQADPFPMHESQASEEEIIRNGKTGLVEWLKW